MDMAADAIMQCNAIIDTEWMHADTFQQEVCTRLRQGHDNQDFEHVSTMVTTNVVCAGRERGD